MVTFNHSNAVFKHLVPNRTYKCHALCNLVPNAWKQYRMVDQNTVVTSLNAFEWLNQKTVPLNPFARHSNSYLTFNHSHGMCMTLEWHPNGIRGKNSNCPNRNVLWKLLHTSHLKLWPMCNSAANKYYSSASHHEQKNKKTNGQIFGGHN